MDTSMQPSSSSQQSAAQNNHHPQHQLSFQLWTPAAASGGGAPVSATALVTANGMSLPSGFPNSSNSNNGVAAAQPTAVYPHSHYHHPSSLSSPFQQQQQQHHQHSTMNLQNTTATTSLQQPTAVRMVLNGQPQPASTSGGGSGAAGGGSAAPPPSLGTFTAYYPPAVPQHYSNHHHHHHHNNNNHHQGGSNTVGVGGVLIGSTHSSPLQNSLSPRRLSRHSHAGSPRHNGSDAATQPSSPLMRAGFASSSPAGSSISHSTSLFWDVVDPDRIKLRIAPEFVVPTSADAKRTLCLLYQQGKCKWGPKCNQVHALPAAVARLREEAASHQICCPAHSSYRNSKGSVPTTATAAAAAASVSPPQAPGSIGGSFAAASSTSPHLAHLYLRVEGYSELISVAANVAPTKGLDLLTSEEWQLEVEDLLLTGNAPTAALGSTHNNNNPHAAMTTTAAASTTAGGASRSANQDWSWQGTSFPSHFGLSHSTNGMPLPGGGGSLFGNDQPSLSLDNDSAMHPLNSDDEAEPQQPILAAAATVSNDTTRATSPPASQNKGAAASDCVERFPEFASLELLAHPIANQSTVSATTTVAALAPLSSSHVGECTTATEGVKQEDPQLPAATEIHVPMVSASSPRQRVKHVELRSVCRLHGTDRKCRFVEDCKYLHICREIMQHLQHLLPPAESATSPSVSLSSSVRGIGAAAGSPRSTVLPPAATPHNSSSGMVPIVTSNSLAGSPEFGFQPVQPQYFSVLSSNAISSLPSADGSPQPTTATGGGGGGTMRLSAEMLQPQMNGGFAFVPVFAAAPTAGPGVTAGGAGGGSHLHHYHLNPHSLHSTTAAYHHLPPGAFPTARLAAQQHSQHPPQQQPQHPSSSSSTPTQHHPPQQPQYALPSTAGSTSSSPVLLYHPQQQQQQHHRVVLGPAAPNTSYHQHLPVQQQQQFVPPHSNNNIVVQTQQAPHSSSGVLLVGHQQQQQQQPAASLPSSSTLRLSSAVVGSTSTNSTTTPGAPMQQQHSNVSLWLSDATTTTAMGDPFQSGSDTPPLAAAPTTAAATGLPPSVDYDPWRLQPGFLFNSSTSSGN